MLADRKVECVSAERECGRWESPGNDCVGEVEGKQKSSYYADRFWKALRALEKQVNPEPWLLYRADVIWLCA